MRTAKALGYCGLYEIREDILAELTGAASPMLDAAGHAPTEILSHMLDLHLDALAALRRPELAEAFARSIALLAPPPRALEPLDMLGRMRGQIDRAWIKRGAQRRTGAGLVSLTHPKHDEGKDR